MRQLRRHLCAALLIVACAAERAPAPPSETTAVFTSAERDGRGRINPRLLRRFKRLVDNRPVPSFGPDAVTLGRMLWFDPRLSRDGTVSCNSCHDLERHGVDGKVLSAGIGGALGRRNSPTVFNAAEHFTMFWDGRAADVEEQATGPIVNPVEMGMTEAELVAVLQRIPGYVARFDAAFPGEAQPITLRNVGRALGAYERGLITVSRWDDFLAGNEDALSAGEREGLRVFLNVGCVGCHTGPQVGASMFQRAGFVEPWPNQDDLGRFEITGHPADRLVFKVPTLKNVAETAPYFHDGSGATLPEAVRKMGRHQLGIDLSDREVGAIVTFLGALTGTPDPAYIARPALPPGPRASL